MRHPFPCELRKQCGHAVSLLQSTDTTGTNSSVKAALKTIPASLFRSCQGVAIATVFQVSILLGGAKGGSGIVIRKDKNGQWGNPIGFGLVGGQFGFQFGAAAIDLVFLLMTENAVKAFAKGNVTLGGELGCALGPHGRVAEADLAIRSVAPVFTYSFSKGLLFTMSVEGIGVIQRPDANEKFYGSKMGTEEILFAPPGHLRPKDPAGQSAVAQLQEILSLRARGAETKGPNSELGQSSVVSGQQQQQRQPSSSNWDQPYGPPVPKKKDSAPGRPAAPAAKSPSPEPPSNYSYGRSPATAAASSSYRSANQGTSLSPNPASHTRSPSTGYSYGRSSPTSYTRTSTAPAYPDYSANDARESGSGLAYSRTDYSSSTSSRQASTGYYDPTADDENGGMEYDYDQMKWVSKGSTVQKPVSPEPQPDNTAVDEERRGSSPRPTVPKRPTKLVAIYSFEGEQEGDLTLKEGDIIILDKQDGDWCTGRNQRTGETGMFPAAYADKK